MVFMKLLKHHSLGRGVPWMSWVGSMKSTPQGCTVSAMWSWSCRVDGFFFSQASNWIDLKEFFEIFRKKTLEGHVWSRLVTFFFCFPPSLNSFEHFSGLLLRNHGACPPKKGHQNNWNRDTLLLFPELARGRYASENLFVFFLKLISLKSQRPLKE